MISVANAMETGNAPALEKRFSTQFSAFYPYEERRGMAPMRFIDQAGKSVTPDDYKGKIVLLHFWATWCAPCLKELPALNDLREAMAGRDDFIILPVALDANLTHAQIERFMKKNNIAGLPVLTVPADDPSWDVLAGFALPTSFLIGQDGAVLYKMVGEGDWAAPDSLAFLSHLLTNQ